MNYKKLFIHAIFMNSLFISAIDCARTMRPVREEEIILHTYAIRIRQYNQLEDGRHYTYEGEKVAFEVQQCLTQLLKHIDHSRFHRKFIKIMQEQATTDELLNKDHLQNIKLIINKAYKNNIA